MIRHFHSGILAAIWLVLAALLGLQLALNNLKYQGLVMAATAERMQVTAATIENVIVRAEKLGLSMDEIRNLDALIDRELTEANAIEDIRILLPNGRRISDTNLYTLSDENQAFILRRVLSRDDQVMSMELDDKLYASRLIYDSASSVMGVILLSTDRAIYAHSIETVSANMTQGFMIIFVVLALTLIPVVVIGFLPVSRLVNVMEYDLLEAKGSPPKGLNDPQNQPIRQRIAEGWRAYHDAVDEINALEQKANHAVKE